MRDGLLARRLQCVEHRVQIARLRATTPAYPPAGPRALHVRKRAPADRVPNRLALDLSSSSRPSRRTSSARRATIPSALELDLVAQVSGRAVDVARGFEREVPVHEQRVVDRLAEHAEELDALFRRDPDQIEHRVVDVGEEDVAGLVLGRRHPLDGVAVEDLANELRLGDLEEERVLEPGVDLVGVAEAHLLLAEPARSANASLMNWLARTVWAFSTASAVVR